MPFKNSIPIFIVLFPANFRICLYTRLQYINVFKWYINSICVCTYNECVLCLLCIFYIVRLHTVVWHCLYIRLHSILYIFGYCYCWSYFCCLLQYCVAFACSMFCPFTQCSIKRFASGYWKDCNIH